MKIIAKDACNKTVTLEPIFFTKYLKEVWDEMKKHEIFVHSIYINYSIKSINNNNKNVTMS